GSTASGATQAVAVNIASPKTSTGQVATVNLLSDGQTATVALGAPANGATAVASNGAASTLVGGSVGGTALPSGATPLLALNVGSSQPVQGTLATVGVVSNGQPVTVSLGNVVNLPATVGGVVTPVATAI